MELAKNNSNIIINYVRKGIILVQLCKLIFVYYKQLAIANIQSVILSPNLQTYYY